MSQSGSLTWTIEPDDGEAFDIEVEYTVAEYDPGNSYGPPEDCYPPEGGEIETLKATLSTGMTFDLADADRDKIERWIYANHEYNADDGAYDD